MSFAYHIPTQIYFGPGSLERLGDIALPGRKALIVTSAGGSMEKLGYLDRVTKLLAKQQIEAVSFNKILPNPIKDHVMATIGIISKAAAVKTNRLSTPRCPSLPSPPPLALVPRQIPGPSLPNQRPPKRSVSATTRPSPPSPSSILN